MKYHVPVGDKVVGLEVENSLLHFDTEVLPHDVMKLVADAYKGHLQRHGIQEEVVTRFSGDNEQILTCSVYAATQMDEEGAPLSFPPLELILENKNNGERKNGGSTNGGAQQPRQVYVLVTYDVGYLSGNAPRHFGFTREEIFAPLSVPKTVGAKESANWGHPSGGLYTLVQEVLQRREKPPFWLAEQLGVDVRTVRYWMRGDRAPSGPYLEKIRALLEMNNHPVPEVPVDGAPQKETLSVNSI